MIERSRFGLFGDVERTLRHEDGMDVPADGGIVEPLRELRALDPLVVRECCRRREPPAVAAHHLVDDEHPRVRRMFGDDISRVEGTLLGGCPRSERLADRHDVIVDRLGKADDRQLIIVAAQICREIGGGSVGVVPADCVQDIDAVAAQLLGGDVQRILALLDQAAFHAVLDVGQLDPAVSDRASPECVQSSGDLPNLGGHLHGITFEQAGIPIAVGDDAHVGSDLGVALDQAANGG